MALILMAGAAKMGTINQEVYAYPAITHSVRPVIPQENVVCAKTMLEMLLTVDAWMVSIRVIAIPVINALVVV